MSGPHRTDIEGMRAIAVASVLLYHAGVDVFGGGYIGVDVFFVLSGFLITSAMVREVERTGKLSLLDFWARRVRRLLPASLVALVGAALITYFWLPITQRAIFGKDIFASATYFVNWRLSARSVNYLDEDVGASPVQHFWSLAVEEQFYIVWPLVMVGLLLVTRLLRLPRRSTLAVAVIAGSVASLAWSVSSTGREPLSAYFSTFTRLWELGIGAVVALLIPMLNRLGDRTLAAAGWVGLAGVVSSVFVFSTLTPWPSAWAALPTVATALFIVSGIRETANSPFSLLSVRPAVWLGGVSYSVYLWHWPLLVGFHARFDGLTAWQGICVVVLSFLPAVAAQRLVEDPLRFAPRTQRPQDALLLGAVCAACSVLCGAVLVASAQVGSTRASADAPALGAAAIVRNAQTDWDAVDVFDFISPDPLEATTDNPDAYGGGCQVGDATSAAARCLYGDDNADKIVMLVGDSKAVQWEPALQLIAAQSGWQLQVVGKSGCAFAQADQIRREQRFFSCVDWNVSALELIEDVQPDLVIVSNFPRRGLVSGASLESGETSEAMRDGYAERWAQVEALGIETVVILDNPNPGTNVYECVATNRTTVSECAFDLSRGEEFSGAAAQRAAAALPDVGVDVIDLTEFICPQRCPAVIGNVLVYRQDSHLTRTYVESLAPTLSAQLFDLTNGELGRVGES